MKKVQDIQFKDKTNFDNFLTKITEGNYSAAKNILNDLSAENKAVNADIINGVTTLITNLENQGMGDQTLNKIIVSSTPPTNPQVGQIYFHMNSQSGNQKKVTIKSWNGTDWDNLYPSVILDPSAFRENGFLSVDNNGFLINGEFYPDETYTDCYKRIVDGEVEWLNPPLNLLDTEYRTAQRFNNRPVYQKLIHKDDNNNTWEHSLGWEAEARYDYINFIDVKFILPYGNTISQFVNSTYYIRRHGGNSIVFNWSNSITATQFYVLLSYIY